jgi:tetratricopeptide (TPR) repeat protein
MSSGQADMKAEFFKKFRSLLAVILIMWLSHPCPVLGMKDTSLSVSRAVNHSYDLLEEGRIDEAVAHLLSTQKKGHDHYLLHFALGNCYMQAGQYAVATKEYLLSVEKAPEYAPAWFNLAKSRYELKDYEKAAKAFISAYDLASEKNAADLYYAGISFLTADLPGKALDVFDRLMTSHHEEIKPEWKAAKVHILLALERNREALPLIVELAITTDGALKKQWQETLLYQYILLDMNDKALSYAEKLTREDPMEPRWWKGLSHLNLNRGRHREALVALTVCGHLTPLKREEKKLMADLSAAVEIPALSVEILMDILLEKWDADVVKAVVRNFVSLHQPDKALEWVETGLSKGPVDADLLMLKGNILFVEKDYAGAASVFEKMTRQGDVSGRPWLMLGYAAWNMEDIETAYRAMKRATTYPRQQKEAEKALQSLLNLKKNR